MYCAKPVRLTQQIIYPDSNDQNYLLESREEVDWFVQDLPRSHWIIPMFLYVVWIDVDLDSLISFILTNSSK